MRKKYPSRFGEWKKVLLIMLATVCCISCEGHCPPSVVDPVDADEPIRSFIQVSVGVEYTCAVDSNYQVVCWGRDAYPNGRGEGRLVAPEGMFRAVHAGIFTTCGIRQSGSVICWGEQNGMLLNPDETVFLSIDIYSDFACGITTQNNIFCWGELLHDFGQLDSPSGKFKEVSVGPNHVCALSILGEIDCWGLDAKGNFPSVSIDDGGEYGQTLSPNGMYIDIAAGFDFTCAIRLDHQLRCWGLGSNSAEQADKHPYHFGQATPPAGNFDSVSAGLRHACAVDSEGRISCWGSNSHGQSNAPDGKYSSVSAGPGNHTCALDFEGRIRCWGASSVGQTTPPT